MINLLQSTFITGLSIFSLYSFAGPNDLYKLSPDYNRGVEQRQGSKILHVYLPYVEVLKEKDETKIRTEVAKKILISTKTNPHLICQKFFGEQSKSPAHKALTIKTKKEDKTIALLLEQNDFIQIKPVEAYKEIVCDNALIENFPKDKFKKQIFHFPTKDQDPKNSFNPERPDRFWISEEKESFWTEYDQIKKNQKVNLEEEGSKTLISKKLLPMNSNEKIGIVLDISSSIQKHWEDMKHTIKLVAKRNPEARFEVLAMNELGSSLIHDIQGKDIAGIMNKISAPPTSLEGDFLLPALKNLKQKMKVDSIYIIGDGVFDEFLNTKASNEINSLLNIFDKYNQTPKDSSNFSNIKNLVIEKFQELEEVKIANQIAEGKVSSLDPYSANNFYYRSVLKKIQRVCDNDCNFNFFMSKESEDTDYSANEDLLIEWQKSQPVNIIKI